MNNYKFDAITITGDKFVCCCDCGKWFPSTEAFTKVYSSTAFMLCPKCANQLEQEIRRYKVKETPAADVVEAARCENCVHSHPCQEDKTDECCDVHHAHWIKKMTFVMIPMLTVPMLSIVVLIAVYGSMTGMGCQNIALNVERR